MKRADKPSKAMPKPKNGISHKPGEVKSRGHAKDKGGFKSKGFKSEGFTGRAPAKKPRAGQSPPRVREKEREGGPPSKRPSSGKPKKPMPKPAKRPKGWDRAPRPYIPKPSPDWPKPKPKKPMPRPPGPRKPKKPLPKPKGKRSTPKKPMKIRRNH